MPTQENIINKNQRIKISRLGDRENNYSEHMNNRLNEQVTDYELEILIPFDNYSNIFIESKTDRRTCFPEWIP